MATNPSREKKSKTRPAKEDLISGGTVVTLDKGKRIIKNGSVAIEGNTIADVGETETLKKKCTADIDISAEGKVVLPASSIRIPIARLLQPNAKE